MKLISWILLAISIAHVAIAQDEKPGKREEKIEQFKIAFLTSRLNLTSDEAQKFWPVYNQFSSELKNLRKGHKPGEPLSEEIDEMTNEEAGKMIDTEISNKQKEVEILKKYNTQFRQVIPVKKVALLFVLEREFNRELLRKIQERKGDGDRPPGDGPGRPRR
ncbi:MAG: hypothetical protein IPO27_17990 [Bacteroidetes bacterium]|nr:hypothetical protein [Bacteroidota bacterium]